MMLNERIISGNWRDPVVMDVPIYRQRYLRYVINRNGRQGRDSLWGIKDPRLCFTFPMFRKALDAAGCPFRVIVSSRPKEAIVKSLEKRGSLAGVSAASIYERYQGALTRVLESMPEEQIMSVPFELLIKSPRDALKRVADFVGRPDPEWSIKEAVEFVDPTLDHWGTGG